MADVGARRDDRAQLLLITAVGIAVLLVVLALALNTAAYAGVHAAQTDDSLREEREVVEYQDSVRRAVSGLIPSSAGNETGYEDLESDLRADVERWNELSKPGYVRDGAATNASLTGVAFESRIVHDEESAFVDRNGSSEWTVASNVSDVSEFEMAVHDEALATTDDCLGEDQCFALEVEGRDGDWRLSVSTLPDSQDVELVVESSDGTLESCTTTDSTVRVNVTEGVFADETGTCEFTSFLEDGGVEPPYALTYTNADNVSGTYALTVPGTVVGETIDEDDRYETTGSPRIDPRIDAANVSVEYRSPDVTYRTEIRVVPGGDDV